MTGPVVPTPPAEVPQGWVEIAAEALESGGAYDGSPIYGLDYAAQAYDALSAVWPLVERMVAERVRAARDEALREAWAEAADWLRELASDGPDLRVNAHRKCAHEAVEFAEAPSTDEAADVLICIVGAAEHHGWSIDDVAAAVRAKVAVNRARSWQQEPDGTWQHADLREAQS